MDRKMKISVIWKYVKGGSFSYKKQDFVGTLNEISDKMDEVFLHGHLCGYKVFVKIRSEEYV